ncbi:hypothetical protein GQX73_g2189 [Xylaria multiplex]|uniref:Uncharacterized protein n=1 Tax=Xylaria multiplex TaxID=323545 RepID=A0A7C8MTV9_9PEZI|nr:hypothetical protein GQX73_g2189 [Xylaria multiplex]
MNNRERAQSVLEFLTAKNPPITRVGGSGQNGSRLDYYCPKAVKPWDEFDYQVLETIFGGELMKEAKRNRSNLPHYPYLDDEVDLRLGKAETITRSLFSKWNHTIVLASLRAVQDVFHPCLWREMTGEKSSACKILLPTNPENNSEGIQNEDSRGLEAMNQMNRAQKGIKKQRSKRSRQPDGGSVSVHEILLKKSGERFPKEYKSACNWNSKSLRDGKYTNKETGEWLEGVELASNNNIAPIRQAYTYCVDYECRYGCILTTSEAFIFRIKPRGNHKVSIDDPSNFNQLLEKVRYNGLMEFVSIPWGNGCDDNHHDYKELTVNLALWFAHILAGNHYKLDWDYRKLHEEELVQAPQQQEHQSKLSNKGAGGNDREETLSRTRAARNKRKRHEPEKSQEETENYSQSKGQQENQDIANFSFHGAPLPTPAIPADHYAAGTQYDNEGDSDEESRLPPIKRRFISVSQGSKSESTG